MGRGEHRGFPDGAFVAFAIAHGDAHLVRAALNAARERHPKTQGQPVSETSRGDLDAGHSRAGVLRELAARLGVMVELFSAKKPRNASTA